MSVRCVVVDMARRVLVEPCLGYTGNINIVDYLLQFVYLLLTLCAFASKKLGNVMACGGSQLLDIVMACGGSQLLVSAAGCLVIKEVSK